MKKVLIVGASFNNKGAQSMLFTTVSEIRKVCEDCKIYFATTKRYRNEENYKFTALCYSKESRQIALGQQPFLTMAKSIIKDSVKFVIGRRDELLWKFTDLNHILPDIDLIIDISGFSIGEKWEIKYQERCLDGIRLAQEYKIPIIFMPQSFGPFEYDKEKEFLLIEIAVLFKYPDIIFARETTGYYDLTHKFNLSNVRLSTDLVLQNTGIIKDYVFKEPPEIQVPSIPKGAVAIIPNMQCFSHGDQEQILNCYTMIINLLIENNKEIYIFRHSREDITACQWIYELFKNSEHVHLITNDFSCLEFDEFIKKFDFIVCSRYHGIVHAYRNAVPSIILGWAEKYMELAEHLKQKRYVFDITSKEINSANLEEAMMQMLKNWPIESKTIQEQIREIQQSSCFSFLKDYL